MKKLLSIIALACMLLLFAAQQAQAIPIIGSPATGTVLFDLNPGVPGTNVATVNWSVYAPNDTASLSGSLTDYTYQYTLNGWTGFGTAFDPFAGAHFEVWTGLGTTSIAPGASGATSSGPTPAFSWAQSLSSNSWILDVTAGAFNSPTSSITGWFTSAITPTESVANIFSASGSAVNGLPFGGPDSILAPNQGTLPSYGVPPGVPPGVPEPETWVLLLSLMGFSTWWIRRRRDEDAPLETSIAA